MTIKKPIKKPIDLPLLARDKALARKIMWVGVFIFLIIIVGSWGWAIFMNISNLNLSKTPEKNLFTNTATNWNQVFQETKNETDKKIYLKKIKNQIGQIFNENNNASTSTESASSTSPIILKP